jgi:molybdopterin synthase sulfur carrier subunit
MVKILYFARFRDLLSCDEERIELPNNGYSVAALKEEIAARGEPWKSVMQDENLLVAVNQTIADDKVQVAAGDEVGFFPPVTGG